MKKYALPVAVAAVAVAGVVGVAITMERPVVTVNGVGISPETVEKHLAVIPAHLLNGQEEAIRLNIIEQLINQEVVVQDAENTGEVNDPRYKEGLNNVVRNYAYNYMLHKAISERLNDEKLKEIYASNQSMFAQPTVKARHILLKTEADAKAVIAQLDKGANFEKLAKEKSTGPSAKNGGDLGYFKQGDMVPAFSESAFALEKGAYTKTPVQTQFGFHVILVEDKKVAEVPAFENVKDALKQQLSQTTGQEYVSDLRKAAEIEYTDKPEAVDPMAEKAKKVAMQAIAEEKAKAAE